MPGRHHVKGPNSLTVRDIYASANMDAEYEKRTAHPERRSFRDRFSLGKFGKVAVAAASAAIMAFNTTPAHAGASENNSVISAPAAETVVYIPGTGGGGTPTVEAGRYNRVDYSAKTPIIDDMQGSIDEAVVKTEAAVDAAGDDEVIVVEGFSQGGAGANAWAQKYGAQHQNVIVKMNGNPCQEEVNGRGGIQTTNPWLDVLTGDTCRNEAADEGVVEVEECREHDPICDSPNYVELFSNSPDKAPVVIAEELAGYAIRHVDYNAPFYPGAVDTYQVSENHTVHYVNYENSAIVDAFESKVGAMPEPLKDIINDVVDDAFGDSSATGGNVEIPAPMPNPVQAGGTPIFDMLNAQFGNQFVR